MPAGSSRAGRRCWAVAVAVMGYRVARSEDLADEVREGAGDPRAAEDRMKDEPSTIEDIGERGERSAELGTVEHRRRCHGLP
ncbi:hypothetical protein [Streptomyces sp. NPDC085540]|uniref:hypothetical protein n=1 Tax=Streptomyces sp. NPDC085540 TaxID=3365730 RepID=UPI0037D0E031